MSVFTPKCPNHFRHHSPNSTDISVQFEPFFFTVVGKVFCGESMFAHVSDASKSAYAVLVKHLSHWGYDFIDCQVPTSHLKSLGAKEVSREYFLQRLTKINMDNIEHEWVLNNNLLDS